MSRPTVRAYLGLGVNLGDRAAALRGAIKRLASTPDLAVKRIASWVESEPVGPADQPTYLNTVVEVQTSLTPHELLTVARTIERKLGRRQRQRWGPREMDIDLLLYGDDVVGTNDLVVPHPELWNRLFVVRPLAELRPDLSSPNHVAINVIRDQLEQTQRVWSYADG